MALTDKLTAIGDAIRAKTGDTALIPLADMAAAITNISAGGDTSVEDSFIDNSLSGTYVNDRVTSIKQYAFYSFSMLTSVNFPLVTGIGNYAFISCSKLEEVHFPLVASIGNQAFQYCAKLIRASFPSASNIGQYAFWTSGMATLVLGKTSGICALPNTNAFLSTPIASGSGYVYVPSALLNTYKTATNWVTYANQIRAIEDYPEITGGTV